MAGARKIELLHTVVIQPYSTKILVRSREHVFTVAGLGLVYFEVYGGDCFSFA
jgi:hypothetical protein